MRIPSDWIVENGIFCTGPIDIEVLIERLRRARMRRVYMGVRKKPILRVGRPLAALYYARMLREIAAHHGRPFALFVGRR